MHGDVPKPFGKFCQIDAIARCDARDTLEISLSTHRGLVHRSHLCDVLDDQERRRGGDPRQKDGRAGHARDVACREAEEELIWRLRQHGVATAHGFKAEMP